LGTRRGLVEEDEVTKELLDLEQRVNELEKEVLQAVDFALYEIANPDASPVEKIMNTESGRALLVEAIMKPQRNRLKNRIKELQ
jgi:hypothetical protein